MSESAPGNLPTDVAVARDIDQICDRFEAAWRTVP